MSGSNLRRTNGVSRNRPIAAGYFQPALGASLKTVTAAAGSGQLIATWMPGQNTVRFPDGVARLIPANSRLSVTIHYKGNGEDTKDQTEVGLYFAKTQSLKDVSDLAVSDPAAIAKAGEISRIVSSVNVTEDGEAIAIRPRAHLLITSLQATLYRPDNTEEVLIWAQGFKFHWQPTYYFERPITIPKGSRIEVIAYLDNSSSNRGNPNGSTKDLRWSEISPEPMCTVLVASSTGRPSSRR